MCAAINAAIYCNSVTHAIRTYLYTVTEHKINQNTFIGRIDFCTAIGDDILGKLDFDQ